MDRRDGARFSVIPTHIAASLSGSPQIVGSPLDRKHRSNKMYLHIDSPKSGTRKNRCPMPLAPAIHFGFWLSTICAAASVLQLPRPATAQNVQIFNETTNAGPGGSAPAIFHEETSSICNKSPKVTNATKEHPNDPVEAAN